ncbi:cobaltochelatase subunit CobN [Flavobacterium sp. MXW15]|uniref:Cobaltochelatase subunit CobN n=1 Tax=Xanthomonas chitinilytica TaxID=2989819 RepID=A0ABT3JZP1_9XANT|nr:cobaltochelatase subunit CobN [Xanthomonas sp. H13-6]MCW4456243.1 cobaltochelatase subunit CobN [Flavobacterium sp. MXW15]MCW4473948.1 cobaltochelatase subunit CobN [Xanthomonas sp. H13-6]
MRRWFLLLAAWLPMAALPLAAAEPAAPSTSAPLRVKVLANDFVLPGKTARLAGWGAEAGVVFEHVVVAGDAAPEAWLHPADLLILDTPRPSDAIEVQERVGAALAASGKPWIRIGGGPPASGGLPADVARRLTGYYAAGGETNFRRLVDYLARRHRGEDTAAVPPPQPMPDIGYYHPQAPMLFASAADYRRWQAGRGDDAGTTPPQVAVVVSPGAVASMQTAVLDAVIARSQAHGVQAFGLWFDAADPQGLGRALDGIEVDAIVNLTHLQNGGARSEEFRALDVPVLQTLNYRQGGVAAWRAAGSGVPTSLVATFIAVPEGWGMSDPLVLAAVERGEQVPIPEQVDALAAKLARLAALRHKPAVEKKLALMFWNYPAGENNLSASHLNVPRSLEALSRSLQEAGYKVRPSTEAQLIAAGQAMLGGYYRPETLDSLRDRDLAEAFPVRRYRQWLQTLPDAQRDALLARWGEPESHPAVRTLDGEQVFLIPRLRLGHLLLMPQPPRTGRVGEATHDQASLPGHYYLAAYQFLREGYGADALIHFGTHGTQEWTPGKDRGLWANDHPFLAVGDLPVFYPYIQDNVGEAVQAKRRGRAVIVSHQTPAFAPAGLYEELRDLHALVHEYMQLDEGGVRRRTADAIADAAMAAGIAGDMGWDRAAIDADFATFFGALHDQLHELARGAMPLGLHTFGEPAAAEHRLGMVMQQLGEPYYRALGLDPQELFAEDFRQLQQSGPYRLLHRHLREGVALDDVADPTLRAQLARAIELDRALADTREIESLLRGLAGGFVAPGAGGDPIRNPDIRSGRNLFPFEPDKIPTRAAYEAGAEALRQLLAAYRDEHAGQMPQKLAFSLWSSEAIRHLGVLESEVLHALGLRPLWDEGGRVTALEIVPDAELAQPRIDVVLQVTSVYRDQFDGFMRLLADAIDRLAAIEGDANAVARNSRALADRLVAAGLAPERAAQLARLRIFGNAPGEYGSGLPDAVLDERQDKGDAALAEQFLSRLQYAYGAREWGAAVQGSNLFAEQLRGVQAAVLARSSNTHGLLSTDHPFEYLGGLSLAVRHLDGASPSLYVADLREQTPRTTSAARFLAGELRSRYLNPHWIGAMQQEGYAGTLEVLNAVNNLFGWQVTDPSSVRGEQWQAIHDTYIRDSRDMGIDAWFDRHNPAAQVQLIERMREAIARGYWHADDRTVAELEQRLRALNTPAKPDTGQATAAGGFGLDAPAAGIDAAAADAMEQAEPSPSSPPDTPAPQVRGRVMQEVAATGHAAPPRWRTWLGLALLSLFLAIGAWRQWRDNLQPSQERTPR